VGSRKRPLQQHLPFAPRRTRRRKKPGPKPREERAGFIPHGMRPHHDAIHPVHVTMRCVAAAPSLRAQVVHVAIAQAIEHTIRRGVGIVEYSIQKDHLHLLVEAADRVKLARGMQLLFSRIAFAVNRVSRRTGRLFRDRHHRHVLTKPTEVRKALLYVLQNGRKHRLQNGDQSWAVLQWLDKCSSVGWFDGWDNQMHPPSEKLAKIRAGPSPRGAKPTTWLLRKGWRQRGGGPLRFDECPRAFA